MEKWKSRRDQDGSVPRTLLPWMLLALFSYHDSLRMDESGMDGVVRSNNFWRKDLVKRNMDCKGSWNRTHNFRHLSSVGLITLHDIEMDMNNQNSGKEEMAMSQDIKTHSLNESKAELSRELMEPPSGMNM
jgi:hypothetical protein